MPDLFRLVPAMRQVSHPLLVDRDVTLVGVSAVLYDDDAYYFEVTEPRYWGEEADGTRSVGIGGVGGGIKQGESVLACLRREVQEELGVEFQIEPTDHTTLIHQGKVMARLDLPSSRRYPAPYIVNLMPPQLGGPGMPDHLAIVTFMGRLRSVPRRGDLFGLLTIAQSAVEMFFERPEWPMAEALAHDDLAFDLTSDLPVGSVLRPTLTGRAFQVLLQHEPS